MATTIIQYTLKDFKNIMFEGFNHILKHETLKTIQTIADQVGSPEYVRTPQFPKRDGNKGSYMNNNHNGCGGRRRRQKVQEISDEDWETIRTFQATELAKKEGIDAAIDLIRKHLNKMTDKTYDLLKEHIVDEIKKIINNDSEVPVLCDDLLLELNKVGNSIFGIASGNKFYSEMYAKLYKELMEKFSFMKVIFRTNFDEFSSLFKNIEYCDPNSNYDKFCENNKVNEKRRAISSFYVNLMKHGIISKNDIINIIIELQKDMMRLLDENDQKNIVEELSEVMFIFVTNSITELSEHSSWDNIVKQIHMLSSMKVKMKPSISSKTIFKCMDMMDMLE